MVGEGSKVLMAAWCPSRLVGAACKGGMDGCVLFGLVREGFKDLMAEWSKFHTAVGACRALTDVW